MNRSALIAILIAIPCVTTGCKDSGSGDPALAKVKGTVNLDGAAMGGGQVRFSIPGRPVKSLEIQNGTFEGEVFVGKNLVEVVWDKDGPPNPTDPSVRMKVNAVSPKFSGPSSPLSAEVNAKGTPDLKFDVTSSGKR